MAFLDCPEYMDSRGHRRCGLPAEVEHEYTVGSTDGELRAVKIRCPLGHWFSGPVESLIEAGVAALPASAPAGSAPASQPAR